MVSFLKLFSSVTYMFLVRIVGVETAGFPGSQYLFWFLTATLFIPEMAFFLSPSFKEWLKSGVEGHDDKMDKSDFKSMLTFYATAWCIRLYVIFGLLEAFFGVAVREVLVLGTLAGAFGTGVIGFFIRKKQDGGQ